MLDAGQSHANVSRLYNIDETMLSKWKKDRTHIEEAVSRGFGSALKIQPLKKYKELFGQAFEMYVNAREMYSAVTIQCLRNWCVAKSPEFAALAKKKQYESLSTFKKHFGLATRKRTGVTQLLPQNYEARVREFDDRLRRAWKEKNPEKIIVMDETSVLWNPVATYTLENAGARRVVIKCDNEKKASTALLWGFVEIECKDDQPVVTRCEHGNPLLIFKGQEERWLKPRQGSIFNKMISRFVQERARTGGTTRAFF
jgi:hypothetical protein